MLDLTLEEAIKLLQHADGLVIDDHRILFGSVNDDENEEEFLELSWPDDGEGEGSLRFDTKSNQTPKLSGSSLFLNARGVGEVQITLLRAWNVEKETLIDVILDADLRGIKGPAVDAAREKLLKVRQEEARVPT